MDRIVENYWFLIVLCFVPLIYWYFTRNFNYWSKRGVNGPKPIPVFGNLLDQFITERSYVEIAWIKKYGKVYGIYNGTQPVLVVAEPELIKDILLKDFHVFQEKGGIRGLHPILSKHLVNNTGEDWKRIRSVVSPTFTSGKMKKMYPMIKECLAAFLHSLENQTNNGKTVLNMRPLFRNLTMDVIATCAFATKTNVNNETDNPFVENANKMFDPPLHRMLLTTILPKSVLKALHMFTVQSESTNQFFFDLIRQIIKERKGSDEKMDDFIQMVLNEEKNLKTGEKAVDRDVNDVNDVNESHHVNEGEEELKLEKKLFNGVSNKYITEDEIVAQAWVFLIAGFLTTATTLTFVSYELALKEDIQQRLYEEVMTAVDANGNIDYYLLSKLPFLDSVISETLRLHSPVLSLPRIASSDYKLGTTGITLYKGQAVQIPIYAMHHLEEFWPEPFRFNPDRFMPENRYNIKPYTYLPFSSGPRNCIGMRFALMEVKEGLAQLIRRFKLSRSAETDVPLKLDMSLNIHSPQRVNVAIEKRV